MHAIPAGLLAGIGLSQVRVYSSQAPDGQCSGTPHLHLACTEMYFPLRGSGAAEFLTADGPQRVSLSPGTPVQFTPGTVHRLVSGPDPPQGPRCYRIHRAGLRLAARPRLGPRPPAPPSRASRSACRARRRAVARSRRPRARVRGADPSRESQGSRGPRHALPQPGARHPPHGVRRGEPHAQDVRAPVALRRSRGCGQRVKSVRNGDSKIPPAQSRTAPFRINSLIIPNGPLL